MVRKESPSPEQPKQPEYFQYILKISKGRLPTIDTEIKNCRKLFRWGVLAVFADEVEHIDPRLEIYFTSDFSKICLGVREETERREALVSTGIETENGNTDMVVRIKNKKEFKVLHYPKGKDSANTLKGILIGNVISSKYEYNNQGPVENVDNIQARVNLPEVVETVEKM